MEIKIEKMIFLIFFLKLKTMIYRKLFEEIGFIPSKLIIGYNLAP